MKRFLVLLLSVALVAGASANRLDAQTTGTSESGVPPALTVVQDGTTPTTPPSSQDATTPPAATDTTTTPDASGNGGTAIPSGTASIQNIVEITRLVPPGTTGVTAFTVPAGVVLVVTDLVLTNTGTAATCGGAVNRTGGTIAPTTPPTNNGATDSTAPANGATNGTGAATTSVAGTVTQTDSTVTGPLCVPAQTTTALPLTTGIEFAAGQTVQLVNVPDTAAGGGTPGALGFHLRGLLVARTT